MVSMDLIRMETMKRSSEQALRPPNMMSDCRRSTAVMLKSLIRIGLGDSSF